MITHSDAVTLAGRLFRAGLADHDYVIEPHAIHLSRAGIDLLLDRVEDARRPGVQSDV